MTLTSTLTQTLTLTLPPTLVACPQSKALRERWLLEGTPSATSEGDGDMRRQMQEDEQKARVLEESISRWVGDRWDLHTV